MTRDTQLTEMLGACGFDWLLIDCEHTPNSEADVLAKPQAVNGSATMPAVRAIHCDVAEIKRFLAIGAQALTVPRVQSVEEARWRRPPWTIPRAAFAAYRADRGPANMALYLVISKECETEFA